MRSLLLGLNSRGALEELRIKLNIGVAHVMVIAVLRVGRRKFKAFEIAVDWLAILGQNLRNFSDGGQLLLLGLHAIFSTGVRLH